MWSIYCLFLAFLISHDSVKSQTAVSLQEEEYLTVLQKEEIHLDEACNIMRNIELELRNVKNGKNSDAIEEIVISMKALLCSAKDKSSIILDKLSRLRKSSIYSKCFIDRQCRTIMPAFEGLEEHFEARNVKFNAVLDLSEDLLKIMPKTRDLVTAALEDMMHSIEGLFQRSQVSHVIVDTIFPYKEFVILVLLLIIVKILDLKTTVFFLIFLGLLFISKYPQVLRSMVQGENFQNEIEYIQKTRIVPSIFHFKEIGQISLHRDLKKMNEATIKIMKDYQLSLPSYHDQLTSVTNVGYQDLASEAEITYKQLEEYIKSLVQILVQSRAYFGYVRNTFQAILEMKELSFSNLKMHIKTIIQESREIEESHEAHKNNFLLLIGDLNKLRKKARKFEEMNDHFMNTMKLGLFGAAVVLNPASLLFAGASGAGVVGGLGALIVAGGYSLHKSEETSAMNSALQEFGDFNQDVKQYIENINDILEGVDASKLRSALQDADEASSIIVDPRDLEYYFGEILEMSEQNFVEVEQIIDILKNMIMNDMKLKGIFPLKTLNIK